MKKVTIEPGCITCGMCEFIAPQVFHVSDIAHVAKDIDVAQHETDIIKAQQHCPVQVIRYSE